MDPDKRPDVDWIFDDLLSIWDEYRDSDLTIQYNINEYPTTDDNCSAEEFALEPLADVPATINYVHSNSVLDTIDSTVSAEEEQLTDSISGLSLTNESFIAGTDNFAGADNSESEINLPQNDFENAVEQFHEP